MEQEKNKMKEHYDIGVVGCWYWGNYGSLLNGYATHQILKSLGLSVLNIVSPYNGFEPHAKKFFEVAYEQGEISPVLNFEELHKYNEVCDMFLTGSDQIWNFNPHKDNFRYDKYFRLDFTQDSKKRISFATSMGRYVQEPLTLQAEFEKLYSRYSAISVREEEGVEVFKNVYGINASVIQEPVLNLEKKFWYDIAKHSEYEENEPYLLTYILDPTNEKREAIKFYGEKCNIKTVNILDGFSGQYERNYNALNLPNILPNIWCADFLKYFINAEFVITDSFHGVCFSLIFNKPFIAIGNIGRGIRRFETLLGKVGMIDRLVYDSKNIPLDEKFLEPMDFSQANLVIEKDKEYSVNWLKHVIETPKELLAPIKSENFVSRAQIYQKEVERLHSNPDFKKIRILATLLRDYGVKHIVLSPGGRDVPLVRMFENNESEFILHSVTDERSAAYYGLGISAQTQKPVACICTSGTAASNYLPAVTEAYYTGVPLILITADRYNVYHEHGEDQTIPQHEMYHKVVKKSITIPEGDGYYAEYETRRDVSDCILEATHNGFGPVHINIAIDNVTIGANVGKEAWRLLPRIMPHIQRVSINNGGTDMKRWVEALKESKRILIRYGQNAQPTEKQKRNIELFASKYDCVIITDFISNLDCAYNLKPYNMLQAISQKDFNEQLSPDILITVGGKCLMDEPLTRKVRGGLKNIRHWHVSPNGKIKDFYFRLSSVLEISQDYFFEWFVNQAGDIRNDGVYYGKWKSLVEKYNPPQVTRFNAHYIQSKFIPAVPSGAVLHLGVGQSFIDTRRYTMRENVDVFCNMGTNGIDGCTSTFMGQCAVVKDKLCFLLVGDLSFFYDMNSIWNKKIGKNVRILLVNNNGTGLLRGHKLNAISSVHGTSAKGWVESTIFEYMSADSQEKFEEKLQYFLSEKSEKPLFFEVFCD